MAKDTKKKKCKSEHKDYGKKGKLPSVDDDQTIESQTVAAKHRHKHEKKQNKKEEEMMCQDNGQDEEMTELKKKKNEDKLAHSDVGASEGVLEEITILKIKKKKKHKKSKKQTSLVEAAKSGECSGCESTLNAVVASTEQHKKKSKKHARISKKGECSEGVELGECSSSKKKHKKHLAEDSLTDTEHTNVKKDKECNKEGGELSDGDCRVNKKNKKRVVDESVTEHTRIKKQKLSNGHGSLDYSSSTTKVTGSEKKRKKKVKHGPAKGELEVVPLDSNVKKSKKEKKQKKCDNGLIVSGTSPLDVDEITTAEKKRKNKKLGGETDKSSLVTSSHDESIGRGVGGLSANKKTNGTTPDGANPRFLGQWGTAELASGERQNKFFRLLGGFKASTGQKVATGGSFNSALTADRETLLNKTLETQFDNAMSYVVNKQRGGGLGYSALPGENKKFHINTTFSNSVKFDD